ncbi:MAG: hypothetical protein BWX56_00329 [Euryarchaeota archaeon ADurb.Bin023]|jgi:hypothetical protein|uniref:Uncharacterized protein n=1 Tax=Candidatus Methanofastidiosum methylothiophilum TaxID=1705564 RepID=A0A150JKP0_9EURY|nr:MAG: hypothetical protein APG09_00992 [Candidatus Methanofastidiosum methylthiophilus]OQC52441.1 MAG: hypothetical protein BWX56_00329 [Euryarchaeota archaeon ADurb.Bin023]
MSCVIILKNTTSDTVRLLKESLKILRLPLKPILFTSSTILFFFPENDIEYIKEIDFSPATLVWHKL